MSNRGDIRLLYFCNRVLEKYILQEINGCNIQSNSKVVHHHNLWRKKIVQVCSNYGGYFMPIDGAERRKFTV